MPARRRRPEGGATFDHAADTPREGRALGDKRNQGIHGRTLQIRRAVFEPGLEHEGKARCLAAAKLETRQRRGQCRADRRVVGGVGEADEAAGQAAASAVRSVRARRSRGSAASARASPQCRRGASACIRRGSARTSAASALADALQTRRTHPHRICRRSSEGGFAGRSVGTASPCIGSGIAERDPQSSAGGSWARVRCASVDAGLDTKAPGVVQCRRLAPVTAADGLVLP